MADLLILPDVDELEDLWPTYYASTSNPAGVSIPSFRITRQRGEIFSETPWAPWLMATTHPSAILRIPEADVRERARHDFIDDLRKAAKQLRLERAR